MEHEQREQEINDQTPSLLLKGWKMTSYICPQPGCNSPLMQRPQSDELLCGRCGYQTTLNDQKLAKLTFSVDPQDLSRNIVEKVNHDIETGSYKEPCEEPQAQPCKKDDLLDAKQGVRDKIISLAQELGEPCNFQEISDYSTAIKQLSEVYHILNHLDE